MARESCRQSIDHRSGTPQTDNLMASNWLLLDRPLGMTDVGSGSIPARRLVTGEGLLAARLPPLTEPTRPFLRSRGPDFAAVNKGRRMR